MSQTYSESKVTWVKQPLRNAATDNGAVAEMVTKVLADVKARGDAAVRDYSEQFDKVRLESFEVTVAQRVQRLQPLTRKPAMTLSLPLPMSVVLPKLSWRPSCHWRSKSCPASTLATA